MSAAISSGVRGPIAALAGVAASVFSMTGAAHGATAVPIRYIDVFPATAHVTVDVRPEPQCDAATLAGARCLPVADIVGPHGRLPNVSGLLWLLGTLGLDGSEHVVVAGRRDRDREFVAGLLYLAGQNRVSVYEQDIASALSSGTPSGKGALRSLTRVAVYRGPMRDDLVVLRNELAATIAKANSPPLIDGRSEGEYWGETIRAARGGHLPGAQSSPLDRWRGSNGKPPVHLVGAGHAVVYAHDGYDGIVLLTRVLANGFPAKVLLDGWAGWAADGSLPADSVTYPDLTARPQLPKPATTATAPSTRYIFSILLTAAAFAGGGFLMGRRSSNGVRTS